MAMSDSYGHACSLRNAQDITAIVMDVAMNYIVRAIFSQNSSEFTSVFQGSRWAQAGKDTGAKRAYLFIISAGLGGMDKEVHLKTVAINIAKHMHEPRFDSAAIHAADCVQNP
jgi:hypothetical protein